MPKIKLTKGDQLLIDELLSDAPKPDHKPPKKALKKRALYRVKKKWTANKNALTVIG